MQLLGRVEELQRDAHHVTRVLGIRLAAPRERRDRGAPQRARVVGPVVGIVVPDRVEDDPFAQRPFADRDLVEVEHVHGDREKRGSRDDELGAFLFEPRHPPAVGHLRPHDALVHGQEVGAGDGELVARAGLVARLELGDHRCEIAEGATTADGHLGGEGRDLLGDGRQHLVQVLLEGLALALRRRIGVDESLGEPADSEVEAGDPQKSVCIAHHELDAAAAEVDAQRRRRIDHDARADRAEDEARLLLTVDHLDVDAGGLFDAVDELASVRRTADRAGGLRDHLGDARRVGESLEVPGRIDHAVGGRVGDAPLAGHLVAEAEHVLLAGDRRERAVGVHVGDEQVEGVRTEVEGSDSHADRR